MNAWEREEREDRERERKRIYDGTFCLSWLGPGEAVCSAGDGSGAAEIIAIDGSVLRVAIGDYVAPRPSVHRPGADRA